LDDYLINDPDWQFNRQGFTISSISAGFEKGFWTWYTPESDTYNQWNIPIVRTKSIPAGMRIIRWKFPAGKNELL
jgi:hypothetical protein